MTRAAVDTAWSRGRFGSGAGTPRVLFGRMYEDSSIEASAFDGARRVFCIASAGCTAIALSQRHDVVAVDINPAQLAYAARRLAGAPTVLGAAERLLALGRACLVLAGWRSDTVRAFLDLEHPHEQLAFWSAHLDTRRFRVATDALLSLTALRRVYGSPFLAILPAHFGAVMRRRLARCIGSHSNRCNPWLRALLGGDAATPVAASVRGRIELVQADAAGFLERQPAGCFDGFTLSNILDGASAAYRRRLFDAIAHAAAPGAMVVLRSFAQPATASPFDRAAEERSPLWGVVDVRPANALVA